MEASNETIRTSKNYIVMKLLSLRETPKCRNDLRKATKRNSEYLVYPYLIPLTKKNYGLTSELKMFAALISNHNKVKDNDQSFGKALARAARSPQKQKTIETTLRVLQKKEITKTEKLLSNLLRMIGEQNQGLKWDDLWYTILSWDADTKIELLRNYYTEKNEILKEKETK